MAGSSSTTFAVGSLRSGAGEGDEIEWLYAIHDQGAGGFFRFFGCFFFVSFFLGWLFGGGQSSFCCFFLGRFLKGSGKGDASCDFGSLFCCFQATSENLAKISRTLEVADGKGDVIVGQAVRIAAAQNQHL